jgi:hypothetical protein
METAENNKLNYLDITIEIIDNTFRFNIYRKPTTTDLIIPYESCHPTEHKLAAIRYLCNRKDTYPIPIEHKQEEIRIINTIMHNNGYTTPTVEHNTKKKRNIIPVDSRKWATLTYVGKETRIIAKLFRNTNIRIAHTHHKVQQNYIQVRPTHSRNRTYVWEN